MFLLLSNQIFCQSTDTPNTNCYSDAQVGQIFKGLKQSQYLKLRLEKTEKTQQDATNLINQQKEIIRTSAETIADQKQLIEKNQTVCSKDLEIKDIEIERLNEVAAIQLNIAKKDGRRKFWNGIKIGGVSVAILGAVGLVLIK